VQEFQEISIWIPNLLLQLIQSTNQQMEDQPRNPLHNYVKYSSLAIQMGVVIFGFAYGGVLLDEFLKLKFPAFTVVLSLFGVGVGLYLGLKDFINPRKK
jgi:uncharacterized membrane protein